MAFVDLSKNVLVLKVLLAGPPAVGKTTRLEQLGNFATFGSMTSGRTNMASLALEAEGTSRPVKIELYEWHGPEKADVRSKALFTGLDGVVYIADAREDRFVDTANQFDFMVKEVGTRRLQRTPGLLIMGMMDEGLLRVASVQKRLTRGPTWTEQLDLSIDDQDRWVEAVRLLGEAMLARVV